VLVGETAVPAIHRLEQVSSEEKVGSLAENLMEALREHPDVEKKVNSSVLLFTLITSELNGSSVHQQFNTAMWSIGNRGENVLLLVLCAN